MLLSLSLKWIKLYQNAQDMTWPEELCLPFLSFIFCPGCRPHCIEPLENGRNTGSAKQCLDLSV